MTPVVPLTPARRREVLSQSLWVGISTGPAIVITLVTAPWLPPGLPVILAVIASGVLAFVLKVAGYAVPERWVEEPRRSRVITLVPVALLSAIVAVQAVVGAGGHPMLDARIAAVTVAVVLLVLRASFLVVVVLAAALVAAGLRALGWMP